MTAPTYEKLSAPKTGTRVTCADGRWTIPDDPIVCLLRGDGSDDDLAELVRDCVLAKAPAHGINTIDFIRPERAMYQIGG